MPPNQSQYTQEIIGRHFVEQAQEQATIEARAARWDHHKAVLRRSEKPDWRIRYAPYTRARMKWLRRLR